MKHTQKRTTQKILAITSLLAFPLTLNFFSPYLSIYGAMNGVITGSIIVFILFFIFGLFFGRFWCSHGCPVAGLSILTSWVNNKPVKRKKLRVYRYTIFGIWFSVLITSFILAGGIKSIDPLLMTENGISVDGPQKYIIYYFVLALLVGISLIVGKRGACHSICWMSPFMVFGMKVGQWLHLPQLKVKTINESCIYCNLCTKACPMSIDVAKDHMSGSINTQDCILCGACVDVCPKDVLKIKF